MTKIKKEIDKAVLTTYYYAIKIIPVEIDFLYSGLSSKNDEHFYFSENTRRTEKYRSVFNDLPRLSNFQIRREQRGDSKKW